MRFVSDRLRTSVYVLSHRTSLTRHLSAERVTQVLQVNGTTLNGNQG
jgi:hypothetical protein